MIYPQSEDIGCQKVKSYTIEELDFLTGNVTRQIVLSKDEIVSLVKPDNNEESTCPSSAIVSHAAFPLIKEEMTLVLLLTAFIVTVF